MRNNQETGECIAIIGSMTRVMRAQSVLAAAAIRVQIVKADSGHGGGGCAYALSYPCAQTGNVKRILSDEGNRVREYRGRET